MKKVTYKITQEDVDHYIASILNDRHEDFPKFVRGIKEFINWLTTKES